MIHKIARDFSCFPFRHRSLVQKIYLIFKKSLNCSFIMKTFFLASTMKIKLAFWEVTGTSKWFTAEYLATFVTATWWFTFGTQIAIFLSYWTRFRIATGRSINWININTKKAAVNWKINFRLAPHVDNFPHVAICCS